MIELPEGYTVEETVDGTFMVLNYGVQIGDNVDTSGAGNDTFQTVEAAIDAAWRHTK